MAEMITFAAEPRDGAGKGPARALRRAGRVPAVIYGERKDQEMVSLEARALRRAAAATRASSARCARCSSTARRSACCRARSSSTRSPTTRCTPTSCASRAAPRSRSTVQVVFLNEDISPGLKRGGVLNIVRREVELVCPADAIPSEIEVDLAHVRHRRQPAHQPRRAAAKACGRRSPIATSRSRPSRRRPWWRRRRPRSRRPRPRRPRPSRGRGASRGEPARSASGYQPCCCWSGSAIPAPATPAIATTSASWRSTTIARGARLRRRGAAASRAWSARAARRRRGPAAKAADLHEPLRLRGRRRPCASTSCRSRTSW